MTGAPAPSSASHAASSGLALALWMLFLTALWGFNALTIKVLTQGMAPVMGAALRGVIALACLTAYGIMRGESRAYSGWDALHGAVNGVIFAVEFVLFYVGARFTTGSHIAIFVNMAPFFVAVGAHYLLPGDRLHRMKTAGLILAFLGVITLFANDILLQHSGNWRGDVLILLGAIMWGSSTLYVKRVMAARMSAFRLLYIQILVSTPLLLAAALLLESGWFFAVTPVVLGALVFQGVVVVFFSYLMWMTLLRRHPASTMQSYTFMSPVWGVFFGVSLLGDPLQGLMVLGIVFVGLGLYLVNRPAPAASAR